jgi:putative glutathione S-transferase
MTFLVDGELRPGGLGQTSDDGEFDRIETTFRESIRDDPDARFRPEAGRYHLYVARACPWAHGAVLTRRLLGLEEAISMDIVEPFRDERGWQFTPEKPGCTPDTLLGHDYLADVYREADPDYTGKVSVPVLWDTREGTIVNNESIEIMRMLAGEFGEHASNDLGLDLYPEGHRDEVDRVVDEIYGPINNGVYRAGFAATQDAYERAVTELFDALGRWEEVLDEQRYLLGEALTLADLRLFPTLVRFDPVYHVHFKCSRRRLRDYPNLWNYTKELYQLPGVAETVNMDHIKEHYYTTHESINPKRIVPVGPDVDYTEPHDRDRLPAATPSP